ncbi:MAG: thioredoxin family protein [Spirochaetales bacterium]|nr:thioredoxin family protein [Spirochaetales bacterium]
MKRFVTIFLIFSFFVMAGGSLFAEKDLQVQGSITPSVLVPGEEAVLTVTYQIPEGFHQTRADDFFFIAFENNTWFPMGEIVYPDGIIENELENYYGTVTLEAAFLVSENIPAGKQTVKVKAAWQICDEAGVCFFPEETVIEIPLEIEGDGSKINQSIVTLLKFLFFAFLGGLLLNVMPCVLPILSMRALNLVRQSQNDRKSIFIGSLLYGAGVLASLLILAVIVIVLKATGQLAGWGFQFQNPLFVISLITIIFVFALSLFDVFIINAPGMNRMAAASGREGWIGSFFNGIFAVLLATPCTAPFLGTALGFAFSQTPFFILSIFTAIGIGFALPFILIGIWPKLIQSLPKPGPWMDTFKEIMGFLLFGTVLYLFSSLRFQISADAQFNFLIFLTLVAFISWIYGKLSKPGSKFPSAFLALVISLTLIGISAYYFIDTDQSSIETSTSVIREGWEEFDPAAVDQYRAEGKGIFLAFGAKWCSVCKLNEGTVLFTEKGDLFFEERSVIRMKGDYTNKDPVIDEWIRKFGKAGVPVYVYYPPDGIDYIMFPEILTFSLLEENIPPASKKKRLDDSMFMIQPSN